MNLGTVTSIVAPHTTRRWDEITVEMRLLDDLGITEVGRANIVIALEKKFSREIPDEVSDAWLTIGDIVSTIS
jgi:acyl carrier protein